MNKNIVDSWIEHIQMAGTKMEGKHLVGSKLLTEMIYDLGLDKILNPDIELEIRFLGSTNSTTVSERHYEIKFVDYSCKGKWQIIYTGYVYTRDKIQ
jgi:hypothetical protein